MTTCPTCGRRPSDANQVVAVSIPYGLLERELHGISVQPERCHDPIHDLADRVVEALAAKDAEIARLREALNFTVLRVKEHGCVTGRHPHDNDQHRIGCLLTLLGQISEDARAALAPRAPIDEKRAEGADRG